MPRTVLVADDDDIFRDYLVTCLETAGHKVVAAIDGTRALRLARESKPDVMLLDLMMPGTHGFEVVKAVRADESFAGVRIIVLSAKNFDVDRKNAARLGVDAYLVKPVDAQELLDTVERVCGDGKG